MSTSCPVQIAESHAAAAPREGACVNRSNGHAPRSKRSSATIHAQIISALQRGLRSRADLCAEVDAHPKVVRRFLEELGDMGSVYVAKRVRLTEHQTNLTELFALNQTPFENEDAPRPPGSRIKERT